jgi:hypothetical protein
MKDETEIFTAKRVPKTYPLIEKRRKALIELMRPRIEAVPLEELIKQDGFKSLYADYSTATMYEDLTVLLANKKAFRGKVRWEGGRAVWGYSGVPPNRQVRAAPELAAFYGAPDVFQTAPDVFQTAGGKTNAPAAEPGKRKLTVDTSRLDTEGVITVISDTYDVDVKI